MRTLFRCLSLVVALAGAALLATAPKVAHAETNLARTCFAGNATTLVFGDGTDCPGELKGWVRPTANTPVLSATTQANLTWNNPDARYRKFSDVASNQYVVICTADITAGQNIDATEYPGGDRCPGASRPPALKTIVNAEAAGVSGSVDLTWTLPTAGCTAGVSPCDNAPLTGNAVLTAVLVYIDTAPIPDTYLGSPVATLAPGAVSTSYSMLVAYGSTMYVRLKAVNASGASAFSDQVFKVINPPSSPVTNPVPRPPTGITFKLTITP